MSVTSEEPSARPTDAQVVAEVWFYPVGSRIVELSAKAPPFEAFQAAAELSGASGGQPAVGPG